jgi:acetolactate synthase-1/2/3 large subunit
MNGAGALIRTLVANGVDVCFMNPGTSEMHFVAALDEVPDMRGVLATFEGVATGAADGYARMAGRPAATLLHLGPGLGNGLANLHNARRARSPIVNIVGDHATYHQAYDAQLQSDIETVARNVSTFVRSSQKVDQLAADALDAVRAAQGPPGQVATLILPADVSWTDLPAGAADELGAGRVRAPAPSATEGAVAAAAEALIGDAAVAAAAEALIGDAAVAAAADALTSGPAAMMVGGRATTADALSLAGAIAARTGAKLLCETFPARLQRGAGVTPVERLGYLAEFAAAQLDGLAHLVLVDAASPVSFFAYPGRPSDLVPDGCAVHSLVDPTADPMAALEALADRVGASAGDVPRQAAGRPDAPTGELTAASVCAALGALLPDDAIVSDEGNTSGLFAAGATAGCPPHDWLCLTGGAIGQGLPVAVGAAVASPGRRVVAFESDGSALYTLQSWWTMAREGLDVTTIVLNNRSYAVLNMELNRVGADPPGPRARQMLSLEEPDLDFVALAEGFGVPAWRARTADELVEQLGRAFATPGPSVVEAPIPSII